MKKAKLISALGEVEFEKVLNEWLEVNQERKIISISHSAQLHGIPQTTTKIMHIHNISALIIFEY